MIRIGASLPSICQDARVALELGARRSVIPAALPVRPPRDHQLGLELETSLAEVCGVGLPRRLPAAVLHAERCAGFPGLGRISRNRCEAS